MESEDPGWTEESPCEEWCPCRECEENRLSDESYTIEDLRKRGSTPAKPLPINE